MMTGIIHGGGLTVAIAAYGGEPADWLDLSTGINPSTPLMPEIPVEIWNRLPDRALVEAARVAASDWYIGASNVRGGAREGTQTPNALPLPVPGTQALIQVLPKLVPPNRPVAILSPTYGEYAHCFRRSGFVVDPIRSLGELSDVDGTLVVVNPNNPDGRTFQRQELLDVYGRMRAQGGHLHVDEAFGDARQEYSIAAGASISEGLTVSRSFGKFFGMAGIRLGFVFAKPETLDIIDGALGPWAVSGPALYLASELMSRSRERAPMLEAIRQRKQGLEKALGGAGLAVVGGTELFALVELDNALGLFEHLARRHILVRKFDYEPRWLRIGLTPDEQGDTRLADTLASFRG